MIRHSFLAGCAIVALAIPAAAQGQGCAQAISALQSALPSAPLAEVVRIYRGMVEPQCLNAQAGAAARSVALRHVLEASRRATPQERLALLQDGLRFSAEPWQMHEALGDAYQAQGAFNAATQHYQLAMNAMRDLAPGLAEPPRETVRTLIARAQQARMLSSAVMPMPRTRDGSPGGLAMRDLRNIAVEAVAQPLHFHDDSDQLTPEGMAAFAQMQEMLRGEGSPAITLIGHTDERGSDAYNDALSLRRAQRVAALLVQGGYAGPSIRIAGRGKRQPFRVVPVQGVTYSQAQRWQLDRRVELVR